MDLNKTTSAVWFKMFRILSSIILIFIAFRQINLSSFFDNFVSIKLIVSILAIFIISNFVLMITSFRWSLIILKKPSINAFFQCFKANYLGLFYNQLLPTSNGGDLIKWTTLKGFSISKKNLLASVFIDRFIGMAALFSIGSVSLLITYIFTTYRPSLLLLIILVLSTVAFLIFNLLLFTSSKVPSYIPTKLKYSFQLLIDNRRLFLSAFALSFISQLLVSVEYVIIGLVWGQGLSLLYMFIFMPLIALFMLLPISIGGFGSREIIFIHLLSQVGLTEDSILAISMSSGIGKLIMAFFGGIILFFNSIISKSNHYSP